MPVKRRCATEDEQELPGDRVEIPHAIGEVRQVPAEPRGHQIHRHRYPHYRPGHAHQQRQHQRQTGQQHNVQRQRVHQVGLEAQQQLVRQGLLRVGDEVGKAHLLHQIAGLHMAVGVEHDAHQHRQQEDMHHIQHPGTAQDLHAGDQVAVALQDFAVSQYRGVASEEDENLRSIAETDVAQGDLA
ncbi:hypothetical protein D3C79_840620 [compost metagenome]